MYAKLPVTTSWSYDSHKSSSEKQQNSDKSVIISCISGIGFSNNSKPGSTQDRSKLTPSLPRAGILLLPKRETLAWLMLQNDVGLTFPQPFFKNFLPFSLFPEQVGANFPQAYNIFFICLRSQFSIHRWHI